MRFRSRAVHPDPLSAVAPHRVRGLTAVWTTAFGLLLAMLLASAGVAVVVIGQIDQQFTSAAQALKAEGDYDASLDAQILAHEQVTHRFPADPSLQNASYTAAQNAISNNFQLGLATFRASAQQKVLKAAARAWKDSLSGVGLWEPAPPLSKSPKEWVSFQLKFADATDAARELLQELNGASRQLVVPQLDAAAQTEHQGIVVTLALFISATLLTFFFLRRLTTTVLRPVHLLRASVARVRSGDLEHRIAIAAGRQTELTELAVAFNEMATTLSDTHQRLKSRALHDGLTSLANRVLFRDRLTAALGRRTRMDRPLGVLAIDLDDFKNVNDELGHAAGDDLLVQFAHRIQDLFRVSDTVARLGGDEFAVLLDDLLDPSEALAGAERIVESLAEPFSLVGGTAPISVHASVGVAVNSGATETVDEICRRADIAMYGAKAAGKDRVEVFDDAMGVAFHSRVYQESALRAAIYSGCDEFRLHYQPIVNVAVPDRITGVEALVRWARPGGLVLPMEFIPIAEETGLIVPLGRWILGHSCLQARQWQGLTGDTDFGVSVNVSPRQLEDAQFVGDVGAALADSGLAARCLILEITESAISTRGSDFADSLNRLKSLGVRLAIDDFGTGQSSLAQLTRLPFDIVKIDQAFIRDLSPDAPRAIALVESIVTLGKALAMDVVAEGVETAAQADCLYAMKVRMSQGYFYTRPVDADTLTSLLRPKPVQVLST